MAREAGTGLRNPLTVAGHRDPSVIRTVITQEVCRVVDSHIVLHEPATAALALAHQELIALDKRAQEAAEAAVSTNTRRAYEMELKCFASWCTRHGVSRTPAEPRLVRAYLRELADQGRSVEDMVDGKGRGKPKGRFGYSALMRSLAAICTSNISSGHATIWNDAIIIEARRAFGKELGTAPKKKSVTLVLASRCCSGSAT